MTVRYHNELLDRLHLLKHDLSPVSGVEMVKLLKALSNIEFQTSVNWKKYYNELLFLLAYPANTAIHSLAENELTRLAGFLEKNKRVGEQLYNSGLPGTMLTGCFSYALNGSLIESNRGDPILYSVDGDKDTVMQFLNPTLSGIEREMLSEEKISWKAWMRLFAGRTKKEQLLFFLRQTENAVAGISAREAVFANFKLYTRVKLGYDHPVFLQTLGKYSADYYHLQGLARPIKQKIFDPVKKSFTPLLISFSDQKALVQLAQKTICSFFKETDPFTHASIKETEYFSCGRGTSIALFYMHPEKKLELECYCGYLLLKNNIPVAYGGGWILGYQCRFGLNILPAFRGGESVWLCSRLMQLFSVHFKVLSFIIEPFQLGMGNTEGIRSAAFWFYYKMGFRPIQAALCKLAAGEFKKLKSAMHHRTPVAALKKLSGSVMRLQDQQCGTLPYYDINAISRAVTALISADHHNDRAFAHVRLSEKFTAFKKQLPLSVMLLIEKNSVEKPFNGRKISALAELFGIKAEREREFVWGMQRQDHFLRLLEAADPFAM